MYMTSVAGSPCAKTVSFPPNLETFLPRPVESRKNFTSNTGVLEFAFLEERETGAETRRVAEGAMRHNTTQLKFVDCSILYSMCRFAQLRTFSPGAKKVLVIHGLTADS